MQRGIMEEIVIRDVEEADWPQIKKMIDDTWGFSDLFESEGATDAALGLYFNQVLYNTSFGKAALVGGRLAGIIFGYANGELPKFRMMMEDPAAHIMSLLNMKEYERQNINEFMTKLGGAYEGLLEEGGDYDGTLDFLVVSEEARGLKIGARLWEEVKAYFQEKKARAIYVFTDTECNFGFYEHLGFSRRAQTPLTYVFAGERLEVEVYLYDYKFCVTGDLP
ncbi:MAG: GNAT family N-acetyltransferase [Spirochaetes bacterium]|nr:GNAT family N-acetyltransferase [Spirochaetota bacterium]